ncbi:Inositol-pentakisphosphate 2-kinase [Niveomyces insectorum RCEF 264]|uniref:Inositol-pentakisphosphate 2-kinase n=1 Tax=Niveomyces insectorum RCEF 264 TaxID=1081102 RepID=A0A167M8T7_9HYPO|nr:Inositol-pentakisphosphate 2-kinase [Niveomyces insectorum RCEF 264]
MAAEANAAVAVDGRDYHERPSLAAPAIGVLPSDVTCTFIGEGCANVVFALTRPAVPDTTPIGSETDSSTTTRSSHLLRIPKAAPGVGPATCLDHHAYYTGVLRPLLGAASLVDQHLVRGVTALHAALNALLANADRCKRRRPDLVGTGLAPAVDVALLVEDMTAPAATPGAIASVTFQFKPKWLAQSPTAPVDARRCRTCALSAASVTSDRGRPTKVHKVKPCPLVLVAARNGPQDQDGRDDGDDEISNALWDYVSQHRVIPPAWVAPPPRLDPLCVRPVVVRWLRTTSLFRRLAAIQQEFDPRGALGIGDAGASEDHSGAPVTSQALDRLQTAMTLRDCTCYLRVVFSSCGDGDGDGNNAAGLSVSAKLGDLDCKDGRRKLARWQAQERALLVGGFYTATEVPRQHTSCWLERQRT